MPRDDESNLIEFAELNYPCSRSGQIILREHESEGKISVLFGPETSMEKDESQETRKTNSDLRKSQQARSGAIATAEYLERDAAMATKTAGLREQRLAREADAAAASDVTGNPKGRRKAASK